MSLYARMRFQQILWNGGTYKQKQTLEREALHSIQSTEEEGYLTSTDIT